ncbi:MAG: M15 family metallopeptidase [Deferribacterales bacterium]
MISRRGFLKLSAFSVFALSAGAPSVFASDHSLDKSVFLNQEYFKKIKEFDKPFSDDMHAERWEYDYIRSCVRKLYGVLSVAGYGNFNILSFDDALRLMKRNPNLTPFTAKEEAYLDMLFHRDAARYGFYGEKVFSRLTDTIRKNDVVKMPGTGHYLYKAQAVSVYGKITSDMNTLVLTSGVRGVVKQLFLFMNKAVQTEGNLSMASRSLAPAGYSYHGVGDFDVGIKGWGADNFTDKFATTDEYVKLIDSGYMRIRYDKKNPFGVRFEPWHVKVV